MKTIILKDKDNKNKTIEIGEPFLADGTFWVITKIGEDVLSHLKLDEEEVNKLWNFLNNYAKEKEKKR